MCNLVPWKLYLYYFAINIDPPNYYFTMEFSFGSYELTPLWKFGLYKLEVFRTKTTQVI